jgi:hypothetical protein
MRISLHDENESAAMQYCQLAEILATKHKSGCMEKSAARIFGRFLIIMLKSG